MPQNHNIIAAKTSSTDVYVFDSVRQLERQQDHGFQPDLILKGHDKEGYGLSWSPFKSGYLLSGSQDGKVCLWDVSNFINNDSVLETFHFYKVKQKPRVYYFICTIDRLTILADFIINLDS